MKCMVADCKEYADLAIVVAGSTIQLPLCKACWFDNRNLLMAHDAATMNRVHETVELIVNKRRAT